MGACDTDRVPDPELLDLPVENDARCLHSAEILRTVLLQDRSRCHLHREEELVRELRQGQTLQPKAATD